MNFYVGTSGYSYPAWKGNFYPEKLPAKQMLHYYGEHFRTVESNDTFRGVPKASVLEARAEQVPADFQFALKAPQQITHFKRLQGDDDTVAAFLQAAGALQKRQGPILFQLPPNFKKDVPRLREFLKLLPRRLRAAFEFRHASWFDDEVFDLLRERQVALCLAEAEDDLETPFVATADWGYLRLRMPEYSDVELKTWVKRIRDREWRDVFVFFRHEDEGRGPKLATKFLELTN